MNKSLIVVLLLACYGTEIRAARTPRSAVKRPAAIRPQRPQRPERGSRPNPADTVEVLSRMPVLERDRALAGLPPQQLKQIEQRLSSLEHLKPAEREQLLNRYRKFEDMGPRQKEEVRAVVGRFTKLSPPRRAAVKQELDSMVSLAPAERAKYLKTDDFRKKFNREERRIIQNASPMLPGQA